VDWLFVQSLLLFVNHTLAFVWVRFNWKPSPECVTILTLLTLFWTLWGASGLWNCYDFRPDRYRGNVVLGIIGGAIDSAVLMVVFACLV